MQLKSHLCLQTVWLLCKVVRLWYIGGEVGEVVVLGGEESAEERVIGIFRDQVIFSPFHLLQNLSTKFYKGVPT